MNKIRRNCKRLSLWVLLFTQILLIVSYFYLKVDSVPATSDNVSFVRPHVQEHPPIHTYHTAESAIFLRSITTRDNFVDFNSSLCYINGTDLISMKRTKNFNWQCNCLPGWHGKDCGQPEVIWRALLTYRKPLKLSGPRKFERRIVYLFQVDQFVETIAEMRLNELTDVVDLFVLYENDESDFLQHKLNNKFAKELHQKILYIKEHMIDRFWTLIRNIRDDDIILTSRNNEIPNKFALNYLKYYNNWPEPIRFRLRWSVFGFFWIHPLKTIIQGGACSVAYFKENFNKLNSLNDNKTLNSPLHRGIILGDLNHYGGWYCEYCYDSVKILEYLSTKPQNQAINLEKIDQKKIDGNFIEDIIENGLYIDGKTELIRAHRYHDNYFAPYYVIENNWKYDYLMINFYSKIDYYEG